MHQDLGFWADFFAQDVDQLRAQEHRTQHAVFGLNALGIIKKEWVLSPRFENVKAWSSLSEPEKEHWDTRMAIYAAMIDRMVAGIGQI